MYAGVVAVLGFFHRRSEPPAVETEAPNQLDPAPIAPPDDALSWETPEYHAQPKTALWYAVFGVVLALLIFSAVLTRSFLSGVVFVLIGVLILLYSERPPRIIRFALTRETLAINDRLYPFSALDAFNIVDSPTGPLLLIRSRRLVMPLLHVPLADQDRDAVRAILRPHLREDADLHESTIDLLAHRLGF